MFSFESLKVLLIDAGLPGAVIGVLVLGLVYVLGFTNLLNSPALKRGAVIVASFFFAGVEPGEVKSAVIAGLAMLISTAGKLLIDAVRAELAKRK